MSLVKFCRPSVPPNSHVKRTESRIEADDLGRGDRDDGEVVGAQSQRRDAEEQGEHDRPTTNTIGIAAHIDQP